MPLRRIGEWMYRFTFSWPRHCLELSGQSPRPLYPLGKRPRYPLDRRLGVPQNRSGWRGEEKILYPTGTRTPTPQSSSHYTNYAIPPPSNAEVKNGGTIPPFPLYVFMAFWPYLLLYWLSWALCRGVKQPEASSGTDIYTRRVNGCSEMWNPSILRTRLRYALCRQHGEHWFPRLTLKTLVDFI
jgi:hypothetical protein